MRKGMLILASLVGLVALVVLILALLGGRPQKVTGVIEIERTPEQIFPYVIQPQLASQWVKDVTRWDYDRSLGTGLGTHSTLVMMEGSKKTEVDRSVTLFQADYQIGGLLQDRLHHSFETRFLYELDEIEGGTQVYCEKETRYHSLLLRLISPMLLSENQATMETELAHLKRVVETQTYQSGDTYGTWDELHGEDEGEEEIGQEYDQPREEKVYHDEESELERPIEQE